MKKILVTMALLACGAWARGEEAVQSTIRDMRPRVEERCFTSAAVERQIENLRQVLMNVNPKLFWMFNNCLPNTLDTTVQYSRTADGDDDTFVITGDINAMWLRDSAAQVWPYLQFMAGDEPLRHLIRGVIRRQLACILIDPYANAFNKEATGSEWESDYTSMTPMLHERKWEIDSLCYPIRLAYEYWLLTGDASIFDERWTLAMRLILDTFRDQQNWNGPRNSYRFMRKTHALHDTRSNSGYGHPGRACGLIASAFRPSDDSTVFPYLVPSNFFAVSVLRKAAQVLRQVNNEAGMAGECETMAAQVEEALNRHAVVMHPKYGPVYAFEVDGYGGALMMDDSNAPSLLSLPYLTDVPTTDPVYQNTRRFVWSEDNPYFFTGKAGEGIGGPHCGLDQPWPMSIIMKALTTGDRAEQEACLAQLLATDGGTGFMHESFNKDDATSFTRSWFAWANTLFGELVMKMYGAREEDAAQLYVGTYNIRNHHNDDASEGNGWKDRCPVICSQMMFERPDVLGIQEAYDDQIADMLALMPGYSYTGVGREDGKKKGEHSAIIYRTDRLQLLDEGHFWLGEEPDKPLKGWDAACERICSWGRFLDRESRREIFFFNLHMDHVGVTARRESARLVMQRIEAMAQGRPTILTGDFNVDQRDEIYGIFTQSGLLRDSYASAATRFAENGTYNAYKTQRKTDSRIDHVFVTGEWTVDRYGILTDSYWRATGGNDSKGRPQHERRNPSDHYPVMVRLRM